MNVQQYFRVPKVVTASGCIEPTVTTTAEYTAVRTRASALGYTLPSATQDAINNRIIFYLKYTNQWDKLDLFYFFEQEAGLADFCTLNWKDPNSFQLNQPNPALKPDFTAGQGFSGGGTKFWFTGYQPRTSRVNLSINNALSMYKSFGIPSVFSSIDYIMGARNSNDNGQIFIANDAANAMLHRMFQTGTSTVNQSTQNGAYLNLVTDFANLPASSTTNVKVVKDQTIDAVASVRSTTLAETLLASVDLVLLAININGTVTASGSSGLGYYALGKGLNPSELPTTDDLLEFYRIWFQTLNGTYLACP